MGNGAGILIAGAASVLLVTLIATRSSGDNKSYLIVNVNPQDANFYIGTAPHIVQWDNGKYEINPGLYEWQCRRSGYISQSGTVNIESGKTIQINISLMQI